MPDSSVFSKISSSYYQLTASEKKVADYVILHQQQTQYMSISDLADSSGVAEATISRFCKSLGYKGYNAFKLAVAKASAERNLRSPLSGAVTPEDSIPDMCQKLFAADADAMAQTQELIKPEVITAASRLLLNAGTVLCVGQGGSMIMAQEAAHLFSTAFPGYICVSDSHMQAITATQLTEKDAVIYFSYSGATRDLQDMLKLSKKCGFKLLLVTRFPKSPGALGADIILQCGSNENPLQLGSIAARMAQLYLLDVLFSEMCRQDMESCKKRRKDISDALSSKHI